VRPQTEATRKLATSTVFSATAAAEVGSAASGEADAAAATAKEYDYIIVGGGTAGCVLANRLTADEDKRVLVLEAGSQPHTHPFVRVPAGMLRLFKSAWDWDYTSEPDPNTANKGTYMCRGKVSATLRPPSGHSLAALLF
jgi:choline dehydrogenase-like flavoprotein